MSISLITWIAWMMIEITTKGMETVFKIFKADGKSELDLVQNWGKATMKIVQAWVVRLQGKFGEKLTKKSFAYQELW